MPKLIAKWRSIPGRILFLHKVEVGTNLKRKIAAQMERNKSCWKCFAIGIDNCVVSVASESIDTVYSVLFRFCRLLTDTDLFFHCLFHVKSMSMSMIDRLLVLSLL